MDNGIFDAIIKKTINPVHKIIAKTSGVSRVKHLKDTKKDNVVAINKSANTKKQRPG